MRLFVSYARVDQPYCEQIIETLTVHDVWHDKRLFAGQEWWDEILARLDWCEGFIYLISPEALVSDYCQKELELAQILGRPIFLVVIHEVTLPEELVDLPFMDFSAGLNPTNVKVLLNAIYMAEQNWQNNVDEARLLATIPPSATASPMPDQRFILTAAAAAMEAGDYDKAVLLLQQAKANDFTSRFISIDALLTEAMVALEHESTRREAEREYRQIAELAQFKRTRRLALEAFAAFQEAYPTYDPDNLATLAAAQFIQVEQPHPPPAPTILPDLSEIPAEPVAEMAAEPAAEPLAEPASSPNPTEESQPAVEQAPVKQKEDPQPRTLPTPTQEVAPAAGLADEDLANTGLLDEAPVTDPVEEQSDARFLFPNPTPLLAAHADSPSPESRQLPLWQWCSIPEGMALLGDGQSTPLHPVEVEAFQIGKYPITNQQYQVFIDDPQGYDNLAWWDFSPQALAWRQDHLDVRGSKFQGDERPREVVNWFDAVAFCRWLSDRVGANISLPTLEQWIRAARGDDERAFPWGDHFKPDLANTSESGMHMTSVVTRYPEGTSPFGVMDMAGNVWEWCLTAENSDGLPPDLTGDAKRAVQGGSFIGPARRAKIAFHYHLQPESHFASIGFRVVKNPRNYSSL